MSHHVLTRREPRYPFRPYWGCACGVRFVASYMGHALYEEFAQHVWKEKDGANSGRPD